MPKESLTLVTNWLLPRFDSSRSFKTLKILKRHLWLKRSTSFSWKILNGKKCLRLKEMAQTDLLSTRGQSIYSLWLQSMLLNTHRSKDKSQLITRIARHQFRAHLLVVSTIFKKITVTISCTLKSTFHQLSKMKIKTWVKLTPASWQPILLAKCTWKSRGNPSSIFWISSNSHRWAIKPLGLCSTLGTSPWTREPGNKKICESTERIWNSIFRCSTWRLRPFCK